MDTIIFKAGLKQKVTTCRGKLKNAGKASPITKDVKS